MSAPLALLFPLAGKFHDLAPALGLSREHVAEPAGAAGYGNGAKLGKSLPDDGVVECGVDLSVQDVDDGVGGPPPPPTP
jgi:hypothetical protein